MLSTLQAAIVRMKEIRETNGIVIDGRKYSQVKDRVELFREMFEDAYGIDTNVVHINERIIVVKAVITNKAGKIIASGHGYVNIGSDSFTSNAPVEVAETSAIGRALACLGLSGGEFASSNEIHKASAAKQSAQPAPVPAREYNPDWFSPNPGYSEDVSDMLDGIDKQLEDLTSKDERAKYWSFIKPFRDWLKENEPEMHKTLIEIVKHQKESA